METYNFDMRVHPGLKRAFGNCTAEKLFFWLKRERKLTSFTTYMNQLEIEFANVEVVGLEGLMLMDARQAGKTKLDVLLDEYNLRFGTNYKLMTEEPGESK